LKHLYFIFTLTLLSLSFTAQAEVLSEKAIFYRCYKQLTQTFPAPNNPVVAKVKSGEMTGVQACMAVLEKAEFTKNENSRIANTTDKEAIAVLRTMQNLHFSWMKNKTIPDIIPDVSTHTKSFVDINGPALYFTKALFTPAYKFKSIFTGKNHYESDRSNNDPTTSTEKRTKADFPFINPPYSFAGIGDLLGVREFTTKNVTYRELVGGVTAQSRFNWDFHLGGGIIGSNSYIMNNLNEPALTQADGARVMPRKWTLTLLSDLLCRDAPVIRYEDAMSYVVNNSATPFRRDSSCIKCHGTLDQAAGVIRGVHFKARIMNLDPAIRIHRLMEVNTYATKSPAINGWSDKTDPDFYQRPSTGRFLYRTTAGALVDEPIANVEALGAVLSGLDDPYVCVAKRYYEYFTGINANIEDIADPSYGRTLSASELQQRNEVINLGKNFKIHQTLKTLIQEILSKPQFKDSNYKIPTN
jgi:hypothetical protein